MNYLAIIHLLIVVAVVFIEQKKPGEAVLWMLLILVLPVLGPILYVMFGSTLGIKLIRSYRSKKLEEYVNVPLTRALAQTEDEAFLAELPLSEKDKRVIAFNLRYNESPLTFAEDAALYLNGMSHYKALVEDIAGAKRQILVEFHTIHHDHVGEWLVAALAEKAKEGVEVLVLYDFLANILSPKKMWKPLLDSGGQVHRVKPFLTHYRNHRKIVVIDDVAAYIGGMNIGKQYVGESKKTPWRDTQVRVTGAAVAMLRYYFLRDWVTAVNRKAHRDLHEDFYVREGVGSGSGAGLRVAGGVGSGVGGDSGSGEGEVDDGGGDGDEVMSGALAAVLARQIPCQFVVGGVDKDNEAIKTTYLSLIQNAKSHIRLQSPYFIPDSAILAALKVAVASGVDVEIMMPGVSASFFLTPVSRWYLGQLLELGAKVHIYDGYVHAKTLVVDEEMACIGSVNMDVRSLELHDEICGVFYDNAFTAQNILVFEEDLARCRPYTYEDFLGRGFWKKFQERFFLLFAPLM